LQDNLVFLLFSLFTQQNYINCTIRPTFAPDSYNLDVNHNHIV